MSRPDLRVDVKLLDPRLRDSPPHYATAGSAGLDGPEYGDGFRQRSRRSACQKVVYKTGGEVACSLAPAKNTSSVGNLGSPVRQSHR